MKLGFPDNFVWGAATASYQIEGAVDEDGRGKSTWDIFCDKPGRVVNGDSGQVACDHYHRWGEDIEIMKELNLKAYRFSLSWPRIQPEGDGALNTKGIDFYDRLIDGLLDAGITPWITLFHWDLPNSLDERFNGWQSRETVKRFADYAAICGEKFGDRVKNWFTINEIACFTYLAHSEAVFAPGRRLPLDEVIQTVHHAMVSHGLAVRSLRATVPGAEIGLVENLKAVWPIYEHPDHIEATKRAFKEFNSQRLFPIMTGSYDEPAYRRHHKGFPCVEQGDMEIIAEPTDFIGYNYYFSDPIAAADNDAGFEIIDYPSGHPKTDMEWEISPRGLYWSLVLSQSYFPNKPIYVTENGQAAQDVERSDGQIMDLDRVEYYRTHLEMCSRAIDDGANLKGYFAWSLLDNFEWSSGYSKRFGLVRVNYRTQKRSIKTSGRFYSDVIKANRVL